MQWWDWGSKSCCSCRKCGHRETLYQSCYVSRQAGNGLQHSDDSHQYETFGFMLGLTKTGRARPRSGEVIAAFCKYLNNSERVKIAGWFVGEDAMGNWIKEIRKLAEEAETRQDASAAKGHLNGAYQEPSHIVAARELMV